MFAKFLVAFGNTSCTPTSKSASFLSTQPSSLVSLFPPLAPQCLSQKSMRSSSGQHRKPSRRYSPSLASPNFTDTLSPIILTLSFRLLALLVKALPGIGLTRPMPRSTPSRNPLQNLLCSRAGWLSGKLVVYLSIHTFCSTPCRTTYR